MEDLVTMTIGERRRNFSSVGAYMILEYYGVGKGTNLDYLLNVWSLPLNLELTHLLAIRSVGW